MPDQRKPQEDAARDVLAAEAFAMPSSDPALRHEPIALPDDPTGIAEPHDVLAAEEFAMPAPRGPSEPGGGALALARRAPSGLRIGAGAAALLLVLVVLKRQRRS